MPKLPRMTAPELEARLLQAGFTQMRSKGSHRIYQRDPNRVVGAFHAGQTLHPKIVKQAFRFLESLN